MSLDSYHDQQPMHRSLLLSSFLAPDLRDLCLPELRTTAPLLSSWWNQRAGLNRSSQDSGQASLEFNPEYLKDLQELVTSLALDPLRTDKVESHPEQVQRIAEFIETDNDMYIWGEKGSGKTVVGLVSCLYFHLQGTLSLYVTNRLNLVAQTARRAESFLNIQPESIIELTRYEPARRGDLYQRTPPPIIISSAQRLLNDFRNGKYDASKVGLLVLDEASHVSEGGIFDPDSGSVNANNESEKETHAYVELLTELREASSQGTREGRKLKILYLSATPAGSKMAHAHMTERIGPSVSYRRLGQDVVFQPKLLEHEVKLSKGIDEAANKILALARKIYEEILQRLSESRNDFQKTIDELAVGERNKFEILSPRVISEYAQKFRQQNSTSAVMLSSLFLSLQHLQQWHYNLTSLGRFRFFSYAGEAYQRYLAMDNPPLWRKRIYGQEEFGEICECAAANSPYEGAWQLISAQDQGISISKWLKASRDTLVKQGEKDHPKVERTLSLLAHISEKQNFRTILTVDDKKQLKFLFDIFQAKKEDLGFDSTWVCGDHTQKQREERLKDFESGKCPLLLGTSVLCFGMDVPRVMYGILYTPFDESKEFEQFLGRLGRTPDTSTSTVRDAEAHLLLSSRGSDYPFYYRVKSATNASRRRNENLFES